VRPTVSVTVHVTVVFPSGKVAGALFVTDATKQLSAVIGEPRATPLAVHRPASEFTTTSAGQVIVGGVTSGEHCAFEEIAHNWLIIKDINSFFNIFFISSKSP
jgi:hypothetical protein